MTSSIFSTLQLAPRDPILGLNDEFNSDPRPTKVNLGIGVYSDGNGKLPLLAAVRAAEQVYLESMPSRGYQPIDGTQGYVSAVQSLLFGTDSLLIKTGQVVTVQALGGTGALKIGADFLRRLNPWAKVYISNPSWENHRAIFESSGFEVGCYPYYDSVTHGGDFNSMCTFLGRLPLGSVVVLHACCHNPTGADLSNAQWLEIARVCRERALLPFLDMAYQGFADGIDADAETVRLFASLGMRFFVANSFSKNFSLYGERVGALSIVTTDKEESVRVLSQLKCVIRTNYSNPPIHGGALVAAVLSSSELRKIWEIELGDMRDRIRRMRVGLLDRLKAEGLDQDFSFIIRQRGMFSYTGLSPAQVDRLRVDFGVYAIATGRICLAALNSKNLAYVSSAIAQVVGGR